MTRLITLVALLLSFGAAAGTRTTQAQAPNAICPGGWTHGGLAEGALSPSCIGGTAELTLYKVDINSKHPGAAASLAYSVPEICRDGSALTVRVSVPELGWEETIELGRRYDGTAWIYAPRVDAVGEYAMLVHAAAGACGIDLQGAVVAVAAN